MEDYRNDYPEYDDEPGASSPDKSIRGYRVEIGRASCRERV